MAATGGRRPNRRFWWFFIIVTLGVPLFLFFGFLYGLPQSITGQVETPGTYCATACPAIPIVLKPLPDGPSVTVHWSDGSGGLVQFNVLGPAPGYPTISQCSENGTSGSCSFGSVGGDYRFWAGDLAEQGGQLVNFTVSYDAPLL
jgi:hypothetical protein